MTVRELIIRNIDGKNVTVPLDRDRITLGRSSANELCYPDDAGLSRQHLALTRSGDQWSVEDLGSKNGTVLNGKRIEKSTPFKEGDRISAGHLTIWCSKTAASARPERMASSHVPGWQISNDGRAAGAYGPGEHRGRSRVAPHFSTIEESNAFVAELARVPTNPYNALNSGEFSYEWREMRDRGGGRCLNAQKRLTYDDMLLYKSCLM